MNRPKEGVDEVVCFPLHTLDYTIGLLVRSFN